METRNKRPKLLSFITILTIVGGIIGAIRSLPLYSLYNSIKRGGVVVEDEVRIIEVQPNTPASDAQLKTGDVIISVNDKNINSSSEFVEITDTNRGGEVILVVERDKQASTVQLTPRVNPPPNEGSIGVLLTDIKVEEIPLYQLIPRVIIRGYSGYEESPTLFFSSYSYQDKSYARLKSLISSVISVAIGIGLWRLRKWAMYGFLLLTAYALIAFLPYLLNPENYSIDQPQSLFFPHLNDILPAPSGGVSSLKKNVFSSSIHPRLKHRGFLEVSNKPTLTDTLIYIVGLVVEVLLAAYIFSKKKLFE